MNCPFCDTHQLGDRIIYTNELVMAFPTNIPIVPGHILITPRRHVKYLEDATREERDALEELRLRIKKGLVETFGAEGFNYAWNEESIGGQSVPHLHLHVIPRKEGDSGIYEYEPREFLYRPKEPRPESPEAELSAVAHMLRNAL